VALRYPSRTLTCQVSPRVRRSALVAIVTVVTGLTAMRTHAEAPPFTLDVAGSNREITIAARPDARIPLTLVRTAQTVGPVYLLLSPFTSAQGSGIAADVRLMVGDTEAVQQPYLLAPMGPVMRLALAVRTMPAAGNFVGSLLVFQDKKDALMFRITLTPGIVIGPAALEVSPRSLTLTTTTPSATFTLTEKTKFWPAKRITARIEDGSEGIDPRYIKFSINEVPVDLMNPGSALTLGPGQAARVKVAVDDLPPGKHTAALRFRAADAADDESGKLALNIQMSRSIWSAVGFLLAALVISFFATKFVVMLRQRLAFSAQIREAEAPWLAAMEPVLPVVWVRDMLHQAKTLGGRWWLTGQPIIERRLSQITKLASVLEKAHQVKLDIEAQDLPVFVRRRARVLVGAIVARLEATTLGDSRAAQLSTELDALTSWAVPSKVASAYREHLVNAMAILCCQVHPDEIEDSAGSTLVAKLLEDLRSKIDEMAKPAAEAQTAAATAATNAETAAQALVAAKDALNTAEAEATKAEKDADAAKDSEGADILRVTAEKASQALEVARNAKAAADGAVHKAAAAAKAARVPARLDEIMEAEELYARLKILWERRKEPEFDELVTLQKSMAAVDVLFERADEAVWKRLQSTPPKIEVKRSVSSNQSFTEWDLLPFFVVPNDRSIATTFLFRHGLRYRWTFTPKLADGTPAPSFPGESTEPSVVVYAGEAVAEIAATVTIEYEKALPMPTIRSIKVKSDPVKIGSSPDTRFLQGFGRVEMVSWGLAGVIAMISGLWLLYAKNPTFGRPEDYLGLLAWGVGVDQGKNLIQVVQSWATGTQKA
jgi:hypothetical protein